jgi:hypothetical protein
VDGRDKPGHDDVDQLPEDGRIRFAIPPYELAIVGASAGQTGQTQASHLHAAPVLDCFAFGSQ